VIVTPVHQSNNEALAQLGSVQVAVLSNETVPLVGVTEKTEQLGYSRVQVALQPSPSTFASSSHSSPLLDCNSPSPQKLCSATQRGDGLFHAPSPGQVQVRLSKLAL
jgi:hypothetical protein